jgi:uncharacterized protein
MGDWVPLARRVLAGYRLDSEGIHGPWHWLRVRANGLALVAMTPGADALVVELFALLHDGWREDEGHDLGHGARAADAALALAAEGVLPLEPARLRVLAEACRWHEHGSVSAEPTIGCCWDADRLDLSRLGRRPKAAFLSTAAARGAELQARAWAAGWTSKRDAAGAAAWGLGAALA